MTRCDLCGFQFTASTAGCDACPLGAGCALICCPRCGYQVPDESQSRAVALLHSAWGALRRATRRTPDAVAAGVAAARSDGSDGAVPLTTLRPGQTAELVSMEAAGRRWPGRLASFGIVAGTPIELLQHSPTPIIRAGHTSLALDAEIARQMRVRLPPDGPAAS